MPLFSRFKSKGAQPTAKGKGQQGAANGQAVEARKPRWESTWNSKTVDPAEVEDLLHACTAEMKSRAEALDTPFLLLPFRPDTDASGARTFIRNYYKSNLEGSNQYRGASLQQELRLTEPIVLCSIVKWCWSRMPGGVVTWAVYEGFQIGEKESKMARNAFDTFIPIGAGSDARKNIIFDFFDLLAAVAAHGKMNGLGGRKLSRLAGWWAFEHSDTGNGFEGGYKSWTTAAEASSHLFFAYLRSCSPEAEQGIQLIERIPRSLQALLAQTEYPPETPSLLQRSTPRVVMLVDQVSPTPFSLLRRAKHFEYRDKDRVLREYSEFEDPIDALTDECKRVLYAISSTNSAAALSRHGNVAKSGQETWSAFQNMGFSDLDQTALPQKTPAVNGSVTPIGSSLRASPRSRAAGQEGRPTTPSWADFLSSGFAEDDEARTPTTLSLPTDNVLPLIGSRAQTPRTIHGHDENLRPGEMAAITDIELDDAFWWVWMTSLAGEEPAERKAVFGRCALIETTVMHGRWLIMEEQVKGASPDPAEGAYIAPKKSFFSFTKRGRNKKAKADPMPTESIQRVASATPSSTSLAPEKTSKIRAAAAELARKPANDETDSTTQRRGRYDDAASVKTSSMLTTGMMNDASPAMKWAHAYDKNAIRAQYLGDGFAGKGMSRDNLFASKTNSVALTNDGASTIGPSAPALSPGTQVFPSDNKSDRQLPALPKEQATPADSEILKQANAFKAKPEPQSPATLPAQAPQANALPAESQEAQKEAEQEPLSVTTPAQPSSALDKELGVESPPSSPNRVSRKPVPRADNLEQHPAFRQGEVAASPTTREPAPPQRSTTQPQSPANAAAIAAQRAMEASSSPESLQKQQYGKKQGGLKKFFGRKKDNPNRNSLDVTPRPSSNGLAPPSDNNMARRLSMMRKKKGGANAAQLSADQPAPETLHESPAMQHDNISHTDSRSDANAEEEFSRFDQGPMEDMPAAPAQTENVDDFQGVPAPAPQRQFNTQLASRIAPERRETEDAFVTPMERTQSDINDAQSEATMEEPQDTPAIEQDRWAKIRENAAKRAARASEEEQSVRSRPSQSMRETDDGETSGEETIESRVARIKARVAELTGGIETNGAARR